jgi:beta-lactamase class A
MVAACLAAALLAVEAPPAKDSAGARIAAIEQRTGRHLGVAALDSGSGRKIEYRPNERFLMCSTFKALAAAAVLKRVDEGKVRLDRFIPYGEKDILAYAPVTRAHLKEGGMKLRALCEAAIQLSDNTAGNLLLQTIGGPSGLTTFARSMGDQATRLDRLEPDLNRATRGDERDTTTPAAMRDEWVKLFTTDALSAASRQQLETWLAGNQTGAQLIRAGVPGTWKVGDKTGRSGQGAVNDVAILHPPDGQAIFLAIYSNGSNARPNEQDSALSEVARIVAESFRPDDSKSR